MSTLQFLGATGTVTGSKYLVGTSGFRFLVDCGLFQGPKELRLRNWDRLPVDPGRIDAVVLTHAHVDHTGYLPRLVRDGFTGPVYATPATVELAEVLLRDSARLQEEEAEYANRKRYSKHHPALPLYTEADARAAVRRMRPVDYGALAALSPSVHLKLIDAGHILGSSVVQLLLDAGTERPPRHLVFSGDLGRYGDPILKDPESPERADTLLLESTYGERDHPAEDVGSRLSAMVDETARAGGVLLIPAFAVGRAQHVLFLLRQLEDSSRIPILPVFLDSPMAAAATQLYQKYLADLNPALRSARARQDLFATADFQVIESTEESKALNDLNGPAIIIAGSGMATGGRILHHLRRRLPDRRTTVVFVGYQAAQTRGRRLLAGEKEVKMHGELVPVRARIEEISGLSSHADGGDLIAWLKKLAAPPEQIYLVHGEPAGQRVLQARIERELGWPVKIPDNFDVVSV